MKTKAEVEQLKEAWLSDASWDIEETEGFEEHKAELLEYREAIEGWAAQYVYAVKTKAKELVCSYELAEFIIKLEARLALIVEILEIISKTPCT